MTLFFRKSPTVLSRRAGKDDDRDGTARAFDVDVGVARHVVALSLPLMGTMVGNLWMMVVDRICLARYSSDTLAASGPAVFTAMTVIAFFTSTANLSRSCVAQALGRAGEEQARHEAFLGIVLAAGLAAVLLALSPVMAMIPGLSSRPPRITALESQFLALAAVFGAIMTLNVSLGAYFNGIGRTKVSMRIGLLGQAVSAAMIYGLVFGRFGLPELGMRGSAWGTLCGTSTMFACYLVLLPRRFFAHGWAYWRGVGWPRLRAQVAFRLRRGAASGAAAGADELGNTAFVWLAALLGPVALAANNLDLTLNYLAIIPIIGLGIGCSVLCGNAIGRDDFESVPRILRTTLLVEGVYVLAASLLQIGLPDVLLMPFGTNAADPRIHAAAVGTARVLWTYSASFVFSMTGAAVLESFGMTRFILGLRLGVMWGISLPLIHVLVARSGEDASRLPWAWAIGSFFEAVIGAVYFLRIRQATARRMNLLEFPQAG